MSLQWTFIATFLYSEIAMVCLFLLPFISPTRWSRIFRSRLMTSLGSYANIYLNIFMLVLFVLFLDSIRDVRKYMIPSDQIDVASNPHAETTIHMKLFRAQRNFYIAGFALFLFLVLRRMSRLLIETATLAANNEAAQKQAQSATAAAKQLLEDQDNTKNAETEEQAVNKEELQTLKNTVKKLEGELKRSQTDTETMKKQAASTNTEYDRLMKECTSLQAEVDSLKGSSGSKKDA